jgi:hypothetical protein
MLQLSRHLALLFAIALGIGETVINWGRWQYAPLWIVDYVIVAWLAYAFFVTRRRRDVHVLLAGWAFTAAVFYMALFVTLDPALAIDANPVILGLIGGMLVAAGVGFLCALSTLRKAAATSAG